MAILNIEDQIARQDKINKAFKEIEEIVEDVLFTNTDEETNSGEINEFKEAPQLMELDDEANDFLNLINKGNDNPINLESDSIEFDLNLNLINIFSKNKK